MGIFSWFVGEKPKPKSPEQVAAEARLVRLCVELEQSLEKNAPGLSRNFHERKLVDGIVEEYRKVVNSYPSSTGELKKILALFTEVYARTALTAIARGLGLKNASELIGKYGADTSGSDARGVIFISFSEAPTEDSKKVQKIGIALKAALESIEPGSYADVDWVEPEGIGSFVMSRNFVHTCFFDEKYRKDFLRKAA